MKICFATNNKNKLKEIRAAVQSIEIVGLSSIGCTEELPENQDTLEGNSLEKANYVFENYQENCFADDTGLEVESLSGSPGVYSARYAGEHNDSEANMQLLLQNMSGKVNRKAQFKTVITLILDNQTHQFEGICKGELAQGKVGVDGFGYDPIFIPEGYKITFAEMSMEEKNKISHRGIAVRELVAFLNQCSTD
jgi:XTP/dITP diphosphohydrolase